MERALLCELHAHTAWSDGTLSLTELVDLHGQAGFDVLCVTDHVLRSDDPWRRPETCVHKANFDSYLAAIEEEAKRRPYTRAPGFRKTFLPCAKEEGAIVAYLCSKRPAYLAPFRSEPLVEPAAAA